MFFLYENRNEIETFRNNENNEKIDRDPHFVEFHAWSDPTALNTTTSCEGKKQIKIHQRIAIKATLY